MRFLAIQMQIGLPEVGEDSDDDCNFDLGLISREIFDDGAAWVYPVTLVVFSQASKEVLVERRRERKYSMWFAGGSRPRCSVCNLPVHIDVVLVNEFVYHGFRGIGEGVFSRWERFKKKFGVTTDVSAGFVNMEHRKFTQVANDLLTDMEYTASGIVDMVWENDRHDSNMNFETENYNLIFGIN